MDSKCLEKCAKFGKMQHTKNCGTLGRVQRSGTNGLLLLRLFLTFALRILTAHNLWRH